VAITRGNLTSFLRALRAALGLPGGRRWSCQSSISFDGVLEETLLPLVTGGEVVLYDEETRRDPDELARRFELDGITAVHCSPSLVRVLADLGWPRTRGVTVMVGGEPLPPSLAATLRERGVTLWNVYGPTETTVLSNVDRVGDAAISLGPPLANNRQHVLDRWLQPVPVGVTGEICISGEGLARGYLDRPDLTAAHFVPDPFATVPGQRLYRSGDLARYRGDGTLDIRGRRDHQVKVRGFRIELGEIEAALVEQPEVTAAVVIVHERTQLVAYVAAEPGQAVAASELRRRLRERLPEYMVPALVVPLPALPLTSNAKVDRAALPRPETVQPAAPSIPRTAHEETISAIWRSALGLPEVGLDDNFFDVGGHSLLLVSVRDQLVKAFATDVPLTVLFLRPTVRALAEHFSAGAVEAVALEGSRSRGEARREAAAARSQRPRVRR
jgi:acyl-coenzyme A synthetase/AMP-(fatty) acid ligase